MEAIANSSGLLYLIGMILIMAVILGGYIVFFITRRRKKPQMKHGLRSSKSTMDEAANSGEVPADELEASANVLSTELPASSPSTHHVTTSIEDKLDLDLLGKSIEPEVTMENTPNPPDDEPVDLAARLNPSSVDSPPPSQVTEPVELLRLLRDPQSGQLIVEIAGQRYDKLASVTDKKIGQYILKLTAHLLAFTNGVIITDAGMKSVYNPKRLKEVPMPIGPASAPAPQSPAAPQKTKPAPVEPSPTPKPPPEAEPPSLGSVQPPKQAPQPSGLIRPAPPPPSMLALNLAEEINDIVQARLRYSPLAENNRIEITSDHHGGIRIQVNHQFYDSPDDVPDPDVKELIKAAIKEWERK